MANFLATTPPLGQQAWGTPHPAAPISLVVTPIAGLGISFGDIGYPPLAAPFRVLILKKYPGTIFPDPKLENVFPCPDVDPIHVEELWDKYDDVKEDDHIYDNLPITDLPAFVERELIEWIAEFDTSQGPGVIVVADRTVMGSGKDESKKRTRAYAFQDDAFTYEPRATKVIKNKSTKISKKKFIKNGKKKSATSNIVHNSPSVKAQYDSLYPAHLVVHHDEPAYIMAQNYINTYAASNEKHSYRVREIISKQGMEPITQRCAKFFAWGLDQPIRRFVDPESDAGSFTDFEKLDSDEGSIFDDIQKHGKEDSPESVINFRPKNEKPSFKFNNSDLGDRVGSFLSEMKAANDQLEADMAAGKNHSLEVDDSDGEHIEMNLGLGVLEEKADSSEDGGEVEEKVEVEGKKAAGIEEL